MMLKPESMHIFYIIINVFLNLNYAVQFHIHFLPRDQ